MTRQALLSLPGSMGNRSMQIPEHGNVAVKLSKAGVRSYQPFFTAEGIKYLLACCLCGKSSGCPRWRRVVRADDNHPDAMLQSEALGSNLQFCFGHKYRIASEQDMPVVLPLQLTEACLVSPTIYKSEDALVACTTCWQSGAYVKQDGRNLVELSKKRKADRIEAAVDYAALYRDLQGKLGKHFGAAFAEPAQIRRLKQRLERLESLVRTSLDCLSVPGKFSHATMQAQNRQAKLQSHKTDQKVHSSFAAPRSCGGHA